jgi:hypothetical protein
MNNDGERNNKLLQFKTNITSTIKYNINRDEACEKVTQKNTE